MTFRELVMSIPDSEWDHEIFLSDRCNNCYPVESVYLDSIDSEDDYENGKPASLRPGEEFLRFTCR